jgi:CheY-like chemotaxis protein
MATKVLVVDDSVLSRRMLIQSLPSDWDTEIVEASNGQEALDIYLTDTPDVIFLDLTMPVMNGFEALEAMAKEGLKSDVIVVSADIQPVAEKRVRQSGAIAFIKKPVTTQKIVSILLDCGHL